MSRSTINELVAIGAGTFGLALYVGLILVPAWSSYTRLWERVAAAFLSLYVLAVVVGVGVGAAAAVDLLLGLRVSDYAALDAITEAVESGAGLPEVVRAAARALEASLAVSDAWGATLAVAARSPAEERALLAAGRGRHEHPAARRRHGRRRAAHARQDRAERVDAAPAGDDDRLRGRARARARARLGNGRRRLPACGAGARADRSRGAARTGQGALARRAGGGEHDRRARPPAGADRRGLARARARRRRARRARRGKPLDRGAVRARRGAGAEVLVLVPGGEEATAARAAEGDPARDGGGTVRLHVRARAQPHRRGPGRAAARGQRGAAGGQRREGSPDGAALAFEQTGAYRLLLSR